MENLTQATTSQSAFEAVLAAPGPVIAIGVGDALSARLAAEAGAQLLYMSGYAVAATHGRPDLGVLTMTEVTTRCREITSVVDLPVIVDADDGYGGLGNVVRTVREFEQAGAVAIQLEDQAFPKKCGALSGVTLLPPAEMVQKIQVACEARRSPRTRIVARTDARLAEGLDPALERAVAYEKAGADILFFQMPQSADEIGQAVQAVKIPTLFTFSESLRVPLLPPETLQQLGVKIIVYPLTMLMASVTAMRDVVRRLLSAGTNRDMVGEFLEWPELNRLVGVEEIGMLERKHR
jgi:2,3-dimethylmalate lyase